MCPIHSNCICYRYRECCCGERLGQPSDSGFQPGSLTCKRRPTLNAVNPGWRVSIDRGAPYSNTAVNFKDVDRGRDVARRKRLLLVMRVWRIFGVPRGRWRYHK